MQIWAALQPNSPDHLGCGISPLESQGAETLSGSSLPGGGPVTMAFNIAGSTGGETSRRREFCNFAAPSPSPSLLKHLLNVEGGCSRMTELSPAGAGETDPADSTAQSYGSDAFETSEVASEIGSDSRRRGFCHSAAPPSPFSRRFNRDGGGGVSKMTVSPMARLGDQRVDR